MSKKLIIFIGLFVSGFLCQYSCKTRLDLDLKTVKPVVQTVRSELEWPVSEIQQAFRKGLKEYLKGTKEPVIRFLPTIKQRVARGIFSYVEIEFENGSFQGMESLNVQTGKVLVKRPRFDVQKLMTTGKLDLKEIAKVSFNFKVNEKDINSYLTSSEKNLRLRNPKLVLDDDRLIFSARIRNRFFSSKVCTEGCFVVNKEKRTVDFRTRNVRLNSFKIPGFLLGRVVRRINPVLKLDRFSLTKLFPFNLEDIKIKKGYVEFIGS